MSVSSKRAKISIFDYKNYRAFLRDWVDQAKATRRAFSHRWFAQKAGFHTSNFLMLVIQGKRNLTEDSVKKCALGLELNKQEEDFFRNLVLMNQAKTSDEKHDFLKHMVQSKKFRQLRKIEKQQYDYYSSWYHPVIRELVMSKDCQNSAEKIAERLGGSITPAQVEKSIHLLESLGMIERSKTGAWKQTSLLLSTGPELASLVVHDYHKKLLDLAKRQLDAVAQSRRDITSMTLGIRKERLPQIIAKIREFRSEVLRMVSEDQNPEEVALLNIQFYPVTIEEG